jgi:hypothetical protein
MKNGRLRQIADIRHGTSREIQRLEPWLHSIYDLIGGQNRIAGRSFSELRHHKWGCRLPVAQTNV